VLGITGLLYPNARTMLRETLRAYGIVDEGKGGNIGHQDKKGAECCVHRFQQS